VKDAGICVVQTDHKLLIENGPGLIGFLTKRLRTLKDDPTLNHSESTSRARMISAASGSSINAIGKSSGVAHFRICSSAMLLLGNALGTEFSVLRFVTPVGEDAPMSKTRPSRFSLGITGLQTN